MATDQPPDTMEASVGRAAVERVAEDTAVDAEPLATALVTLHCELLGHHGRFERLGDYVTVDGTRAYRVPIEEWELLTTTSNRPSRRRFGAPTPSRPGCCLPAPSGPATGSGRTRPASS
jgi:hypothetical protein